MMKYSQVNSEQKYLKIFLEYSDLNSSWDYSPVFKGSGVLTWCRICWSGTDNIQSGHSGQQTPRLYLHFTLLTAFNPRILTCGIFLVPLETNKFVYAIRGSSSGN